MLALSAAVCTHNFGGVASLVNPNPTITLIVAEPRVRVAISYHQRYHQRLAGCNTEQSNSLKLSPTCNQPMSHTGVSHQSHSRLHSRIHSRFLRRCHHSNSHTASTYQRFRVPADDGFSKLRHELSSTACRSCTRQASSHPSAQPSRLMTFATSKRP